MSFINIEDNGNIDTRQYMIEHMSDCCSLGSGPLNADDAAHYAELFSVLADATRLQILSELAATGCEPKTVNEVTEIVGLSQPTVSHHLKRLTDAGLLEKIRVGRSVTHSIRPEVFADLRTVLHMD